MLQKNFARLVFCILVCGWAKADDAKVESRVDRETYLKDLTTQLQLEWPDNRMVKIVCHGHSVPAGYFKTPIVDTFNAYPHLLHRQLHERFPTAVINVMVTSIGGESSDQGALRFERDVLSLNPDLITIDYGLNDRRIGLEEAKKAWIEMIRAAQAKGVKIILLTPTGDLRADLVLDDDPLVQHAEQIRGLAKEYGVGLADSFAAFQAYAKDEGNLADLMSQVNHPNRKGHDLVVKGLMDWFSLP